MARGPFFWRLGAIWVHLDAGAVPRHGFDLDAHHLRPLKFLEHPVHDARLGPPIHARANGVPIVETPGQAASLAALLCDVQDRIQHIHVGQADIAPLRGQPMRDLGELCWRDFQACILSQLAARG